MQGILNRERQVALAWSLQSWAWLEGSGCGQWGLEGSHPRETGSSNGVGQGLNRNKAVGRSLGDKLLKETSSETAPVFTPCYRWRWVEREVFRRAPSHTWLWMDCAALVEA